MPRKKSIGPKMPNEKDRLFCQEVLLLRVTQHVHAISKDKKVSRRRLAKKIGRSLEQITRWMGGEDEPSLRDVSDLFWALGMKVDLDVSRISSTQPLGSGHLLARKDDVLCTICGETEPVFAGKATPVVSLIHGYKNALLRHPDRPHDPHVPFRKGLRGHKLSR